MAFRAEKAHDGDYGLLGVGPGASRREVKAAYRRLAKEWHPDRFHEHSARERDLAEEKFKALTSAYRRIAGGWLDEGAAGDQHPPKDSPPGVARGSAEPRPAPAPGSGGRRTVLSRLASGWRLALSGLLLALAASLYFLPIPTCTHRRGASPSGHSSGGGENVTNPGSIALPESREGVATPPETRPGAAPPPDQAPASTQSSMPAKAPSPELSSPRPSPSSEAITLGSSREDVLRIQGPPQAIRGQTWVYGVSELGFKDGRVVRFNNFDGSLKIRVHPSRALPSAPPRAFTIGSSEDEVLAVQGTPTRMDGHRWMYGFSEIRFKDGRVEEYDNFFGNLNIQLMPEQSVNAGPAPGSFTVGSTRDEVLLAQGTPTSIRGNLWYYGMSSVLFRKGKVQLVHDSNGILRFTPKEELTRSE